MQNKTKLILAVAALPVIAIGWALFRPELLFVNNSVNEKLPTTGSAMAKPLSKGTFASYAHETKGTAQIFDVSGKSVLRLSDFMTSNGPDVHVLLVKGTDPQALKDGSYIDLGNIKGNQGDQNYELPAGTKASDYSSVTIWCKRFSVSFGGAVLKGEAGAMSLRIPTQTETGQFSLANYQPGADEIRVTAGKLSGASVKGSADLVERAGKRYLRLAGFKAGAAKSGEVYIIKKETLEANFNFSALTKVKLGDWKAGSAKNEFEVSKDLDVWLYRSVIVWDSAKSKAIATAALRSDQEKKKTLEQA